jgi:hypothetical protein
MEKAKTVGVAVICIFAGLMAVSCASLNPAYALDGNGEKVKAVYAEFKTNS